MMTESREVSPMMSVVSPLTDVGSTPPPPSDSPTLYEVPIAISSSSVASDRQERPLREFNAPPPMLRQETLPLDGFSFGSEGARAASRAATASQSAARPLVTESSSSSPPPRTLHVGDRLGSVHEGDHTASTHTDTIGYHNRFPSGPYRPLDRSSYDVSPSSRRLPRVVGGSAFSVEENNNSNDNTNSLSAGIVRPMEQQQQQRPRNRGFFAPKSADLKLLA